MDDIFDAAAKRFSNEQSSRKQQAVAKAEAKAKERAALAAKKAKWEADAAKRREEEAKRQAEEQEKRDEDLERNRGVAFVATLRPELSRAAEAKGIIRRADKIVLPRSASVELEQQHATKNGQMFFELSTPTGRVTHASILDFSAAEGTVGLPEEVCRLLGLHELAEGSAPEMRPQLQVRYRALKRGTFARVQPVAAAFASDVGDVKLTLERELQLRTTLTEGDELRVHEGGAAYALRITELQPEGAASIIDTDLEVDVLPSVEYEEAMRAEAERAKKAQEALERARAEAAAKALEAAQAAAAAEAAAQQAAQQAAEARAARRQAAADELQAQPEPEPADGVVAVQVRCPDGTRATRRFHTSEPSARLFALVEASAWAGCPADFLLCASYPRRVVRRSDAVAAAAGRSLLDAGLSGKQEALFVELVEEEAPAQAGKEQAAVAEEGSSTAPMEVV
jgi:hypothetical protein